MDCIPGQLSPFPMYRNKATGERFRHLRDAAIALGKVTFDPTHVLRRKPIKKFRDLHLKWADDLLGGKFGTTTMFKEIETVLPEYDDDTGSLLANVPGDRKVKIGVLAEALVEEMVCHVTRVFPEAGLLCVPHSAGYDSRLISLILKEACGRIGGDAKRRVRLACWEPTKRSAWR